MKKMNLNFTFRILPGMKISKAIMSLAVLFLFGFGFNTISAQYVSKDEAYVRLTNANVEIMKNWESLQQSGNVVAIQKAKQKQFYLRAMIQELKSGSTVKETVEKFIGTKDHTTGLTDLQLNSKANRGLAWLRDEILNMLEL